MNVEIWTALAIANFAASLAPGQNVAYLGAATVRMGPRGGLAAVGGILLAESLWSVMALALALGTCEISPALFQGLQVASSFVLIWLGLGVLRDSASGDGSAAGQGRGHFRCAARGVWVGLANPLALIFFLSLLPGFVTGGTDASDPAVIAFYASAVLVSSAAGLAPYLIASDVLARAGQTRRLQAVSGCALLLLGALVLLRQLA